MLNFTILIFVGGAFGAICRELLMLVVPRLSDGFPLDIFIANIIAAFLLGLCTSLYKRNRVNQYIHMMVATVSWEGYQPSPALYLARWK
ncbi:camphor resistance protein CrcB [Klebsiella pneumoniae]|uniref:Fluoride-specific ion channel n=1 Tax=Klebsiella pneumoniae TaxID=573 RepID=A0A377VY47_KLEPN|nr:camphor resistance protein CrcB [Klebsiella pneumoniae]